MKTPTQRMIEKSAFDRIKAQIKEQEAKFFDKFKGNVRPTKVYMPRNDRYIFLKYVSSIEDDFQVLQSGKFIYRGMEVLSTDDDNLVVALNL